MMIDPKPIARFIVCESSKRWQLALFRFADQMVPQRMVAEVIAANPIQVRSLLRGPHPTVVFWEHGGVNWKQAGSSENVLAQITALSTLAPRVVQFVVGKAASPTDPTTLMITELGTSGLIQHPEHIVRWRHFFLGHFARIATDLD